MKTLIKNGTVLTAENEFKADILIDGETIVAIGENLCADADQVIDAAGKPLGKTAVTAANILRGKHRPEFTPHVDCGEYVVIINCDKAVLTGKKLDQKFYRTHSGYIGGLKETKARTMMENRSDYAMEVAVKGMLPKNTLGRNCMTRLHLYKGAEHPHAAQKPEAWTLD
mgnify:CR=1 FL=1